MSSRISRQLENVRLERLNRLFDNLVDLPAYGVGFKLSTKEDFVGVLPAKKNWPKIRRRIQENEHQVRDSTRPAEKADMLADAVIASRNGRNVLPVKKHLSQPGFAGWSTISASGIPFISSLEQSSILMKKLPIIEPMNGMKSFRFWRIVRHPAPSRSRD